MITIRKEKLMYGQVLRDMLESADKKKTWEWLRKADLRKRTESLLCAAQEQVLRTNVKHKVYESTESPLCRMCKEKGETYITLSVSARRWHKKHINEGTTTLRGLCIGIYVRNTI